MNDFFVSWFSINVSKWKLKIEMKNRWILPLKKKQQLKNCPHSSWSFCPISWDFYNCIMYSLSVDIRVWLIGPLWMFDLFSSSRFHLFLHFLPPVLCLPPTPLWTTTTMWNRYPMYTKHISSVHSQHWRRRQEGFSGFSLENKRNFHIFSPPFIYQLPHVIHSSPTQNGCYFFPRAATRREMNEFSTVDDDSQLLPAPLNHNRTKHASETLAPKLKNFILDAQRETTWLPTISYEIHPFI